MKYIDKIRDLLSKNREILIRKGSLHLRDSIHLEVIWKGDKGDTINKSIVSDLKQVLGFNPYNVYPVTQEEGEPDSFYRVLFDISKKI